MDLKRLMLMRREQLQKGRDDALAQANANAGAIAEIDYWLQELDIQEKEHENQEG